MEQIGAELRKLLMAGIGAVSTTVDKSQELIGKLAEKGEITYEQAKVLSQDVADKVKKAVDDCGVKEFFSGKPKVEAFVRELEDMSDEELAAVRQALDSVEQRRKDAKADCCCGDECCECHFESGDKADAPDEGQK